MNRGTIITKLLGVSIRHEAFIRGEHLRQTLHLSGGGGDFIR